MQRGTTAHIWLYWLIWQLEDCTHLFGQSSDHPIHQANWRIGELDGQVTGACNSHVMSMDKSAASIGGEISTVLKPLNELKEIANGTWYVAAIATYPEFRARGVGRTLLQSAETMARNAGNERLTLMVGSFNHSAQRLYRLYGFQEWERRQFVPFSGSDKEGEWILMYKNL